MPHRAVMRQIESDLQTTAEGLYDVLFEQAPDGIVIANARGCYLAVNRQACALLGYTREELLTRTWRHVILANDLSAALLSFAALRIGETVLSERWLRRKDGCLLSVEIRVHRLSGDRLLIFIHDLRERKRAEQAQHERRTLDAWLAESAATAPDVIGSFRLRPDGSRCFPYASPDFEGICGMKPADLEDDAAPFFARIHPDDLEQVNAVIAQSVRTMLPVQIEYRVRHPDKGDIWVESRATPEREPDGSILWHGIIQDISTRKQAETQLLYQASVLQSVSDAIITADMDFTITAWNHAAEVLYGWSAAEAIGQPIGPLLQTEYIDNQHEQMFQQFLAQGYWKGEVIHHRKDGTPIAILGSIVIVKDSSGKSVGAVSASHDISARKQAEATRVALEEQLRQAQKMESMGRLVGGVAHNFNNLLTVIQGYSDIVLAQLPIDNPLHEDLEQIRLASNRAAALTRQLLAFSRKQILTPMVLDLNSLIMYLSKLLEPLISADITLEAVLQPDLWPITADPSQIEQALMNLILNARDAMATGGQLTITTRNVPRDEGAARPACDAPSVLVSITDTGCGIDAHIRSQIFEPFFTTKAPGQGTGLGLATVYGTIKQSGGEITVDSTPGVGTTFTIVLPVGERAAAQLEPENHPNAK